ncbi:MAG: SSI family serine proteinase inhibitor [Thermoleophilia bacterium]|nr:SSI family serine proteinase inhibitor [Thermoleophilia bacterium]MDH3725687.1 SSI family serine proteinase inhibitor [Thermoleophilia bacterium]
MTPRLGPTTLALLFAIIALAAACSDNDSAGDFPATGGASLTIVLADPEAATSQTWTLGCDPASGDLPDPESACGRLSALDDPWAPVPADVACAEIFGGPQVMTVSGDFHGESVDASFTRSNACEIERFDRVADALGIAIS